MSYALQPHDVLKYLNELGYQNISSAQLKEFMKDLKRLIKYEQKQVKENLENISPAVPYDQLRPSHNVTRKPIKVQQNLKKNKKIVSLEIKRPTYPCHTACITETVKEESFHSSTPNQSKSTLNKYVSEASSAPNFQQLDEPVLVSPKRVKSCESQCTCTTKNYNSKAKKSYIIPRPPAKTLKSDPVALYHKYQNEWKKQKLPGENNHSELRWAIRERMLGQRTSTTVSAAPSIERICKKHDLGSGF